MGKDVDGTRVDIDAAKAGRSGTSGAVTRADTGAQLDARDDAGQNRFPLQLILYGYALDRAHTCRVGGADYGQRPRAVSAIAA